MDFGVFGEYPRRIGADGLLGLQGLILKHFGGLGQGGGLGFSLSERSFAPIPEGVSRDAADYFY